MTRGPDFANKTVVQKNGVETLQAVYYYYYYYQL